MDDRRFGIPFLVGTKYRLSQFLGGELIVFVVLRIQVHIKLRLGTVTKIGLLEYADITQIFICGVGRRDKVTKEKVGSPDELLPRILDAAASVKKREDQPGRTAHIFALERQNALRLTVGFSNIHCEQ
jgi:hypothetical protein